ncbi:ATP-binding protein [Labrys wisconsinensis]|uniref:Energy-coupling factor transporter ATP-binding protein EcfA2 n=1 Tax=Labrys wisconsinensis TaxID=425677 RepID=A0ABU0JA83_9HYPH|nr:ATP-binding protein [Labrys wisconsinensis]MDQ0470461.1 energy-coupling factor transporter ATP-binding protein EcfA2 [Labrys wisconsinensis]
MKIEIEMGSVSAPGGAGGPAMLDIEELLATRLLVQGNSGSGKSHLLRRLLEQSAPHVQQVIVDPEGEFSGLAERFGHVVVDADRSVAELGTIAGRVRQHRVSAVLNLESLDAERQMRAAAVFLNALFDAERDHWYPMLVVVDEAQLFAPAVSGDVAEEVRKLSLGAMTNLMCRGRKRGLAGIIATQRLAKLAKNVAAEASNFLMGRTFLDIDMARAADLLGLDRRQAETFRELQRGHFVALGPAISRRPLPIKVGPVETQMRAAAPKLTPLPEQPSEEARELILAPVPAAPARAAAERRPSVPPPLSTNQILEQVVRNRPAAPAEEEPVVPWAEREALFRRIAYEMMLEPQAHFRPEPGLYQDFLARCRLEKLPGALPLADFRLQLSIARAGLDPAAVDAEAWQAAIDVARRVPSDLQAVFLILAAAALQGAACPSNMELAHRCGSHSAGRAKSQIRHLERAGFVVTRADMRGNRIAAIPDLGWETALGDPNAPAAPAAVAEDDIIAAE